MNDLIKNPVADLALPAGGEDGNAIYAYVITSEPAQFASKEDLWVALRRDYRPELDAAALGHPGYVVAAIYRFAPISPTPVVLLKGTTVFFEYAISAVNRNMIGDDPVPHLWNDALKAEYGFKQ